MAQQVRTTTQQSPVQADGAQRMPSRPVFLPPADIYETKDSIVVLAEMPGVPPEGVDLTLERRVLTIRAQRGRGAQRVPAGLQ
jgi:HSP20 family protein